VTFERSMLNAENVFHICGGCTPDGEQASGHIKEDGDETRQATMAPSGTAL